jgi:uncharacterized membrane protein YdfJ with MMPL/SSD domain
MSSTPLRSWVTGRPGRVVVIWVAAAVAVGLSAPDLTRLAAEGQSQLLGRDAESLRAGESSTLPQSCKSGFLETIIPRTRLRPRYGQGWKPGGI